MAKKCDEIFRVKRNESREVRQIKLVSNIVFVILFCSDKAKVVNAVKSLFLDECDHNKKCKPKGKNINCLHCLNGNSIDETRGSVYLHMSHERRAQIKQWLQEAGIKIKLF